MLDTKCLFFCIFFLGEKIRGASGARGAENYKYLKFIYLCCATSNIFYYYKVAQSSAKWHGLRHVAPSLRHVAPRQLSID